MDKILSVRSNIYDRFQSSPAGKEYFIKKDHAEEFAAYYTAMYLIQDTGESVQAHRERGFSPDPWLAYIEFWGVMQAIFIQQDAIKELYQAVVGSSLPSSKGSAWMKLRDARNLTAGHPANRTHGASPTQRTFMARSFGNYDRIRYELWDARDPQQPSHPTFNLSEMIEAYDIEGAKALNAILDALTAKWREST